MRLVPLVLFFFATLGVVLAGASPAVTIDVSTGDVLFQQDATQRWFPASTTKLMTVYVALAAVRDHRIAMDTPLVVSARAHRMPPARMGFPTGTKVTLGNALKMLVVHSPNDLAITIAEGISGTVEAFADDMNRAAATLGMRDSHFVNPNGLPAPGHYVSARDMAILAHAVYTQFPNEAPLFDIGELALGKERIDNTNTLLGRYPGMDGMKTGYTCAAGWNLIASASRGGRRLVVVVFGAPTADLRNEKVVTLFDRGFDGIDRAGGSILSLPASTEPGPPDLFERVCGKDGSLVDAFTAEVAHLDAPLTAIDDKPGAPKTDRPVAERIADLPPPVFTPVQVHIGADPGYTGIIARARAPHTPIGTAPTRSVGTLGAQKQPRGTRGATGSNKGRAREQGKMPRKADTTKVKKAHASS